MVNPKNKKTIGILIPENASLSGRNLKEGLRQLFAFFTKLRKTLQDEGAIDQEAFLQCAQDLDRELLKKIEAILLP